MLACLVCLSYTTAVTSCRASVGKLATDPSLAISSYLPCPLLPLVVCRVSISGKGDNGPPTELDWAPTPCGMVAGEAKRRVTGVMANLAKQKKANDLLVTALQTTWGHNPKLAKPRHGYARSAAKTVGQIACPRHPGRPVAGLAVHEPLNTTQNQASVYVARP